jgi:hypothetical protein
MFSKAPHALLRLAFFLAVDKKKYFFVLTAFIIGITAAAQNTFPATGNVGIGTTTPSSPLYVTTPQTTTRSPFNRRTPRWPP